MGKMLTSVVVQHGQPWWTGSKCRFLRVTSIDCEAGYGPTFGAGHDLHISGNAIINYHTILSCSY